MKERDVHVLRDRFGHPEFNVTAPLVSRRGSRVHPNAERIHARVLATQGFLGLAPTGTPKPNAAVEATLMMGVAPVDVIAVAVEGAPMITMEANTVVPRYR